MGTTFVQSESNLFTIDTPLGADKLLLKGFRGSEGISRLFHFDLDLFSEDQNISFTDIVGKNVTMLVKQADGTPRHFNGVISRFGQGGVDQSFTSYHAEMVPWLWFLTRSADCRILQNKTVPQIIKQIFGDLGFNDFSDSLKATYSALDYCVQYRETDFNFVSRLMEEYGIFYFFKHEKGKHTLVLADDPSATADCPGQKKFRYYIDSTAVMDEDVVQGWHMEQDLRTGKCTLSDYNFQTPSTSLLAQTNTIDNVGGNSKYDTYDYPGKYLTKGDGQSLTKIRMQEEESVHMVIHGASDARSMASGFKFTLSEHYRDDMNTSYLLTDVEHVGSTTSYGTTSGAGHETYSNTFKCIPATVPFRPLRVTPRPTIMGPQPALVVGPAGEEIYTDKYGRIKVQFFWDRLGKKDENSSCWMRVSQIWAGKNWGVLFLPRVGQEVMVDFLEGDPDQPLVTGSVYNAEQMPPYTLPDKMTQSVMKTRSTKGGGSDNFNEIHFEDKMGQEMFFVHAEKDMTREVEHDDSLTVGNNQTIKIQNDRTETVTQGNEKVTIQAGNRTIEVSQGNDDHKISQGNRSVEISMGNDSLKISMGNQTTKLDLGASSTDAMQSITLTVGQSSIKIDQMGVTIQGAMISIKGMAQTQVQAPMVQVNADAMLQCQGGIVMIN